MFICTLFTRKKDWLKSLIKPLKNPKTIAVYGKQIPMFSTNSQDYRDLKLIFGNEKRIQKIDYFSIMRIQR